MATANFKTMKDFPLIVSDDIKEKICPECGLGNRDDEDKCEGCGCDLSEVKTTTDDFSCSERTREMEQVASELNDVQAFFAVSVESGYYYGVQFFVDEKYCDLETWDNETAQEEFGVCRSEMLRRFKVAKNTICRGLRKAAKTLGLDEIICIARFSNGEAMFQKVEPNKPLPVRMAAKVANAAA